MGKLSPVRRRIYTATGVVLVGVGVLGIVTPVLPTTVFFLLASALFVKASPRLHAKLHRSRVAGPYLRAYTEGAGLSRGRKASTIIFLWVALLVSAWFVREHVWVLVFLGAVGIGVTLHVALIRPKSAESRGIDGE